jgi:hypothetical protein
MKRLARSFEVEGWLGWKGKRVFEMVKGDLGVRLGGGPAFYAWYASGKEVKPEQARLILSQT